MLSLRFMSSECDVSHGQSQRFSHRRWKNFSLNVEWKFFFCFVVWKLNRKFHYGKMEIEANLILFYNSIEYSKLWLIRKGEKFIDPIKTMRQSNLKRANVDTAKIAQKNVCGKMENCHDKCLMSLALALWKQNKSVIEKWWKLFRDNERVIFKTYFSKRRTLHKSSSKGGGEQKMEKFYDSFIFKKGTQRWISGEIVWNVFINKTISFVKFFILRLNCYCKCGGEKQKKIFMMLVQ